ncbi:LysR family transcriptional regulator [Thioclava sp. BHET1]|nr:LysR family transcriptional regulator [Thioclava sp. BHET1]
MAILSRLRFKQLALVTSLVETANLRASARELNLSQPGATKMLREVEDMLGVELFTRTSKGMTLTIYGLAVASHARLILAETMRLKSEVDALQRGERGTVRMGAIMEAVPGVLADLFARLAQSGQGPRITLTVATSDHLIAAMNEGQLDLVLGRPVAHLDMGAIRFEPLWPEELSIVGAMAHPLLEARSLTLRDLRRYEWILQPRPSPMRTSIELTFARAGLDLPSIRLETASMLTTAVMASGSDLLAVLPRSVARFYAQHGLVREIDVALDGFMGRYGLLRPNKYEPDPAVDEVAELVMGLRTEG